MVGSVSDPLSERRGWTAEEIRSHWNWAPGSSFLNNSEFSFTWRLARNALPLLGLNYRAGLADMPDCTRCGSGLEETAEHAFYNCERVVFLAILAAAWMVIRKTQKKGLYDDANFSHRDLVLYFKHQLRVKIRCDRKRLDGITFDKRWVNAASQVVRKGAMLESSFPPLPVHGIYGTGPSGPHSG